MSQSTSTAGPRVVLIGPMGAGKTSIGQQLAGKWGLGFRDTDHDIEAEAGKPISDIFVDEGEPHFRELEEVAVQRALTEHTGVLALGGGAVMSERTRGHLAGHTVVFLDLDLATAAKRVGMGQGRPLVLGNVRATLRKMLTERRPVYLQAATVSVDTSGRSRDDVVLAVEAALSAHRREQA